MARKEINLSADLMQETEQSIKRVDKAAQVHAEKAAVQSRVGDIRIDPARKIWKNIKVTPEVEQKMLAIAAARNNALGKKLNTFDTLVFEAMLEYIDNHYSTDVEG